MRIMHVTWGLSLGGTESLLVDIANVQVESVPVSILIINNNVAVSLLESIDKSIEVFCINRPEKSRKISYLFKIALSIIKAHPTILHLHHYGLYRILRFTNILMVPTNLTAHSTNYPCVYLEKHKRIFAISESVRKDLKKKCSVESTTILNGINPKYIRQRTKHRWDSEKPFKMVQVGRLQHMAKGQHLLLFALRKLISDYGFSNFRMDFIGEGPSLDWLKCLVTELKLQKYCRFLGATPRPTVYDTLADYHLLIQPSLWEGFGLTLVEAMAAKVPVLASDIDAPKEVLQNGDLGTLFKSGTSEDLVAELFNLITHYNSVSYAKTTTKAFAFVIDNFLVQGTARKYIDNYKGRSCLVTKTL